MVVPCSGIGKTYGTVSREAAYEVTEDLRPGTTELVALSLLVLGDEEARAAVRAHPAVTIDGCKLAARRRWCRRAAGKSRKDCGARRLPAEPGAQAAGHRRAERGRASLLAPRGRARRSPPSSTTCSPPRRARPMPDLPETESRDRRLLRRGAGRGDGDAPGRAESAGAAAPRRDGDHLPAALPGRRRRRPGLRPFYPTIAVDGCDKRCAARATEKYSGKPAASVVVTDLVAEHGLDRPQGAGAWTMNGRQAVEITADRVAGLVDELLGGQWNRRSGSFVDAAAHGASPRGATSRVRLRSGDPGADRGRRRPGGPAGGPAADLRAVPRRREGAGSRA